MEISGTGKSPNASLSFRYNANNEELEELFHVCDEDPPTMQFDASTSVNSENASPKRPDRTPSIIDKYFKSMRAEKFIDKPEDIKSEAKVTDENRSPLKEPSASPMKEYLNRLGKRNTSEIPAEVKEGPNETWKIFHDFKSKFAQAVEDMKTRSVEETKEKSIPRENSTSDSEENSAIKDSDQSVGDTDNQVSSLHSSIQNLSEMSQPITAKPDSDNLFSIDFKNSSDSSDDTHKNLVHSDSVNVTKGFLHEGNMEVESGVEALEDTIDSFGDLSPADTDSPDKHHNKPVENVPTQVPQIPTNFGLPPSKSNLRKVQETEKPKSAFLNFTLYFLTFLLFVNYLLFPNSNIWNGFFLGIWSFYFVSNVKQWLLDNYFSDWEPTSSFFQLKRSSALPATFTIPSVKEHKPLKKYEGWINHYRFPEYDPYTYRVNKSTTAFMKLEGCNLRISYTRTKIGKRALWNEKIDKVVFYQHRLYNLTEARVILLPKGLVSRRQWSKKYPICIILGENEKIQVLEKEGAYPDRKNSESVSERRKDSQSPLERESIETNTSPEKKKKFVWRRREKSIPHAEVETLKEGLRHRIVRKMHREKKTDSVCTGTESLEASQADKNLQLEESSFYDAETELASKSATSTKDEDEDLDDNDLSKIKDFLEEDEMETGAAEGEWSIHVKQSKDKHSMLYFFARTGRDKHEWFRRIQMAIMEANAVASTESSAADDKSAKETSDVAPEAKDGIETALYKVSEKETVAFAKTSRTNQTKPMDTQAEGVTVTSPCSPLPYDMPYYEKTFWPYLLKIIQTKNPVPECQCRMLPGEVAWLNTVFARIFYDVAHDQVLISRLQTRIQRKLNTLKLPSFMSQLVVTELSLAGACPLVERVSAPALDERGVWLDADLRYDGGAHISILTQINLMKLKEKNVTLEEQLVMTASENVEEYDTQENAPKPTSQYVFTDKQLKMRKPAVYDSEVEDSAESSSDDESPPLQPVDSSENVPATEAVSGTEAAPASSKRKFLRMVDKIATNKYFQQVTDYKYVKRAMEGLSNTDIKLQLEVQGLEGRLALNLPPPPHDRLWVGFRSNPQLVLKARPAVGARTLRFAHISNWIEQKLSKEFEKVLVLPNMEDIVVGVMTPTPIDYD